MDSGCAGRGGVPCSWTCMTTRTTTYSASPAWVRAVLLLCLVVVVVELVVVVVTTHTSCADSVVAAAQQSGSLLPKDLFRRSLTLSCSLLDLLSPSVFISAGSLSFFLCWVVCA